MRILAVGIIVALLAGAVAADEVVLQSGDSVTGTVQGDHLEIETSSGRLSVPYSSLKQLTSTGDGAVTLELVDGSSIQGKPLAESVNVRQSLFDRVVPLREVKAIRWDPPKVTVPASTPVPLELIRTLNSRSAQTGASVEYCVTQPVKVDGKTVIANHAPAWGEVLGTSSGHNVGRGDKMALLAKAVAAVDGSEIPLHGTYDVSGGFNAGAVVAGGVFGLLAEGNPAEAGFGARFDGQTDREVSVALTTSPPPAVTARQQDCDDYYSVLTGDFVPAERLRRGKGFAPVSQPLRVSVPLLPLLNSKERSQKTVSLGSLRMEDLSIAAVLLEIDPKRRGGADLQVTAEILVRPSVDRLVNLDYQLVVGDQTIKVAKQSGIKAAEGKVNAAKTKIELSGEQLAALLASADPRLRISMTAIED
jgi:hypothetical protein